MLVRENRKLDVQDMQVLRGAKKERVEEYARCELLALVPFASILHANSGRHLVRRGCGKEQGF